MKKQLLAVSVPSVLNEPERLAMFHPYARGKTSDGTDCQNWSSKSGGIVRRLLDAFKSYQPGRVGTKSDANRSLAPMSARVPVLDPP